jgi:hypothetical protein
MRAVIRMRGSSSVPRTRTSRAIPILAIALLAAGCSHDTKPFEPVVAAPPQSANVGWTESFPAAGPALIFRVGTIRVLPDRWEADISIENQTEQRYEIPPATSAKRLFGVMIFSSDSLDDLKRRSESGDLPTIRSAQAVTPSLPPVIAPGERWTGTISAAGALPAGQWVRIVFGPLTVKGTPPKGVEPEVTWITDHAYRLSGASPGVVASIADLVP